jgi:hypothetical protein
MDGLNEYEEQNKHQRGRLNYCKEDHPKKLFGEKYGKIGTWKIINTIGGMR